MAVINFTPQRESRMKSSLSPEKQTLCMQLVQVLNQSPLGVHVTFSQLLDLCRSFDTVGNIVQHLTKNHKTYSLEGIGRLFAQEINDWKRVQDAYNHARQMMEQYNNRHVVTVEEIIHAIEHTPVSWEFEGFYDNDITWCTSDNVIIRDKHMGKYIARLRLSTWHWFIDGKKYGDSGNRYSHPHVSTDGVPCYGNAAGLMTKEKGIVKNLEGLWSFLHSYNAESAYRPLASFR